MSQIEAALILTAFLLNTSWIWAAKYHWFDD